jgi:hypothetical protein
LLILVLVSAFFGHTQGDVQQRKIELLSEDGLKRPKHVGGLLNVCILVCLFIVQLLTHIYYGFETCSLILREELRLRVFENRVLRGIFGPKKEEVMGEWRNCTMWSLMICNPHQILFG